MIVFIGIVIVIPTQELCTSGTTRKMTGMIRSHYMSEVKDRIILIRFRVMEPTNITRMITIIPTHIAIMFKRTKFFSGTIRTIHGKTLELEITIKITNEPIDYLY